MIVGCAAGAVCVGAGFIVKKKANQATYYGAEPAILSPPANSNYYIRVNLIAAQNGAGVRLTF